MNDLFLNACHLRAPDAGFPHGQHVIASEGGADTPHGLDPLMDFSILRLKKGQTHRETPRKECVFVLLGGAADVFAGSLEAQVARESLFDEGPTSLHCGAHTSIEIGSASSASEWAVIRTTNKKKLSPRLYRPTDCSNEDRGAGLAQGACRRLVRTVFDYTTRPDSNLVVGEVVNYPGRWSSYPPHHHPQPEIYHYRFTLPQGYGHAELGDSVCKVRQGDTVLIPGGLDHGQVSAPGYGMYYLWVVRHLPRRPYKGFTFTQDHRWLLDPAAQGWQPAPTKTP